MIKIANAQLWVHDQDEALAFYTEKLGMEVRADVTLPEMGDFRWLTVGPGRPGRHRDHADGDPRPAGDGRRDRRAGPRPDGQGLRRHRLPHHRRLPGVLRGAEGAAASSSPRRPRSAPTASTPGSATRRATASGSRRCGSWPTPTDTLPRHGTPPSASCPARTGMTLALDQGAEPVHDAAAGGAEAIALAPPAARVGPGRGEGAPGAAVVGLEVDRASAAREGEDRAGDR